MTIDELQELINIIDDEPKFKWKIQFYKNELEYVKMNDELKLM